MPLLGTSVKPITDDWNVWTVNQGISECSNWKLSDLALILPTAAMHGALILTLALDTGEDRCIWDVFVDWGIPGKCNRFISHTIGFPPPLLPLWKKICKIIGP